MDSLKTKDARAKYSSKWGLDLDQSPLVAISPALDLILTRPGDPAHSEYSGIGKLMHEMLLQGILTVSGAKSYARCLRQFPFPKGWGRLQSPLHHLKSYSFSDQARWCVIVPGLLRVWLERSLIQPHFFAAALAHTKDPVGFIVSSYAAFAKSTSLLVSDHIDIRADRDNLDAIVTTGREAFQQLCRDAAGGMESNSRRGSIVGNRSRSATPAPGTMGPPTALQMAAPSAHNKGAAQYRSDVKRPNVHTGLHYARSMDEYGLPGNVGTLIGEDKHRCILSPKICSTKISC